MVRVTESEELVPNSTYMWYPVLVPQMVGGFTPVCPAATKVSEHAVAAVRYPDIVMKSSLN